MPDFSFELLNPIDFEELSRDLIQVEYNIRLECFTPGKDGGIDFRHIFKSSGQQIIVQCKHHKKGSYSTLKRELKQEIIKMGKINPERYILCTSVGLTPTNKNQIKSIFQPYIQNTSDILGFDDLNNLLRKHDNVVKNNYKLWFNGVNVLEKFVHSGIYNQSDLDLKKFEDTNKIFVKNNAYKKVKQKIKSDNICIITGNPGIGKSTIALFIASEYVLKGYEFFSLNTIEDAIKVYNPKKKQFFYYDDFLGQSIFGDKLVKNEDTRIITLINSLKNLKSSKFLLTTRSYIFNQAKIAYEKFNDEELEERQYVVVLDDYSLFERAMILYNHLWYSSVLEKQIRDLIDGKNYLKIITHRNFTPRIIKVLTNSSTNDEENFTDVFLKNLENPKKLWEHPFQFQFQEVSKQVLLILNTLPLLVELDVLKMTFEKYRTQVTGDTSQFNIHSEFKIAIKELDGSLIQISKKQYNNSLYVKFENPSIHDYINHYLIENSNLLSDICNSLIFFEQNILLLKAIDSLKEEYSWKSDEFYAAFFLSVKTTFYSKKHLEMYSTINRYEERLLQIINWAYEYNDPNLLEIIDIEIPNLFKNIEADKANFNSLCNLIITINKNDIGRFNSLFSKEDLNNISKLFFLRNVGSLNEFENLLELHRKIPLTLSQNEFDYIRERFLDEFKSYDVKTNSEDYGWEYERHYSSQIENLLQAEIYEVETAIESLKSLSFFFDIDIDDELDDLKKYLNTLYEENPEEDEDELDESKDLSPRYSKEEIITLFSSLLQDFLPNDTSTS